MHEWVQTRLGWFCLDLRKTCSIEDNTKATIGNKTESYMTEEEGLSSPLYAYHTLSEIEKEIYNGKANSKR